MNFLKRLFGQPSGPLTKQAFWEWFGRNDRSFHKTLQEGDTPLIEKHFLQWIMPRLQAVNPQFYCEAGMFDDTTAELIVSAEGDLKTFVFVEELIAAAPRFPNWRFTALKPSGGVGHIIKMDGAVFNNDNIRFFYDSPEGYPDEINITLVHQDFSAANRDTITHGCLLYLDSVLGELNAATLIDYIEVKGPGPANGELVPMEKLGDFLTWKEKEFVEKYQDIRHDTANDRHAVLEGQDADGFPTIASINTDLLDWDGKASHPWLLVLTIDYERTGGAGNNGMPIEKTLDCINQLQDELTTRLPDSAGYLWLGRETHAGKCRIFIACREYRASSATVHQLIGDWKKQLSVEYEIEKDKYWRVMSPFREAL